MDVQAFYIGLGANITAAREARGVTQESLAAAVGLTRPSITNIEKGRQKVLAHTIMLLAASLNLPLADLMLGPIRPPDRDYSEVLAKLPENLRSWVASGIAYANSKQEGA